MESYPWKGVCSTRRFGWNLSVRVENLGSLVFGTAAHVFYALCSVQCNVVIQMFRSVGLANSQLHAYSGFSHTWLKLMSFIQGIVNDVWACIDKTGGPAPEGLKIRLVAPLFLA